MLTLLSPAKKLNFDPAETTLSPTKPVLQSDVIEIAKVAKKQSADDLKRLMHISDNLAELNAERFKTFNLDGQSNSAKQAGLAFDGDVYWGLAANSMSDDTLSYAQDHLRILSGLYGVLRPLDAIQPYRLEMGTKIENPRGKSLYDFWGTKIADQLNADMQGHKDHTIVNLASNEYFKAVAKKSIDSPVLSAKFLNVKDGQARALMYYAKYGRGLMARWIMDNRVERADDLKDFDLDGYSFDKAASSDSELVFTRPQPPKK
ncbi:peroxide stress protein YaaA [Fretibacter rubidus]|uniref:peroxide stress protein YaaA n=1 Tax=Fretibacter rubidus TaxID=570162 RepID=UPI003529E066